LSSPTARRDNVSHAFAVRPGAFTGKHVAIVDDVFTTGATVGAVARAVRAAGAKAISVAVLAHG